MSIQASWYFDYISPFAYLQCELLGRNPLQCDLTPRAVLFAGLLNHHGQKGPAEIPAKRLHTYRQVRWMAQRHDMELNMPRAHPFNPLPLLRATIAAHHDWAFVRDAFRFVWVEGHLPQDDDALDDLLNRHGLEREAINHPQIKDALRAQTNEAIERGVFGVPTTWLEGEVYWGVDTTEMVRDRLANPEWFSDDAMAKLAALPEAARR